MNEVGNHKTQYEVIEEFKEKFNTRQKVLDFMVTLNTDRQRTMNFDEMFKFEIGDEVEVNKFVTDVIDIEWLFKPIPLPATPFDEVFVYVDGSCSGNPGPMGIGVYIQQGEKVLHEISEKLGHGTNNLAEYNALIHALKLLADSNFSGVHVTIHSDSKLMVNQVNGEWKCKNVTLDAYMREAQMILKRMLNVSLVWISRDGNLVNSLVQQATT